QRNSCACGAPFSQADVSEAEWKGDRGWRRRAIRGSKLFDSSLRACEAGLGVPEDPANHASIVVDVADDVVQRRERVEFTLLLHVGQLLLVKLRISDSTPVVSCGIHREAGRQGSVGADDQRIPTGAATPRFDMAAQEFLHLQQPRLLVDDLVALLVFL